MATETHVTICDGKYTAVLREDGSSTALRYGEAWPAYAAASGLNNLEANLAREVEALREALNKLLTDDCTFADDFVVAEVRTVLDRSKVEVKS